MKKTKRIKMYFQELWKTQLNKAVIWLQMFDLYYRSRQITYISIVCDIKPVSGELLSIPMDVIFVYRIENVLYNLISYI